MIAIGVEAASGLAGEIRVGRRGLRRVVLVTIGVTVLLSRWSRSRR